jgi:hypothetical protein
MFHNRRTVLDEQFDQARKLKQAIHELAKVEYMVYMIDKNVNI